MFWYFLTGRNIKPDIYLGIIFMLLFLTFLFAYFQFSGIMEDHPWILFLDMGVPFILGPVIWFYIISIAGVGGNDPENRIIHLVPAIMIYLLFADIIFLPPAEKSIILNDTVNDLGMRFQIENILQFIPVPAYLTAGLLRLKRYEARLKTSYSSIQKIRHRWLKLFLLVFLVYWFIVAIGLSLNNIYGNILGYKVFLTGWLLISVITGFYGIRHNRVIKTIRLAHSEKETGTSNKIINTFGYADFENYINDEKPYLDPDLHISELAKAINKHPYQLSRVLNVHYKTSFYDYIGKLRGEEFKKHIDEGEYLKYPILQVAYNCGFNSKSAFYRIFRKYT